MDENKDVFIIRSEENMRVINVPGSSNIILTRKNPHGFWFVSFERGTIPESLDQAFTNVDMALVHVKSYLENSKGRQRAAEKIKRVE